MDYKIDKEAFNELCEALERVVEARERYHHLFDQLEKEREPDSILPDSKFISLPFDWFNAAYSSTHSCWAHLSQVVEELKSQEKDTTS